MNKSSFTSRSRRQFLGEASCATVGTVSMMSALLNLRMTGSLAAASDSPVGDDYKALVCVFLAGGNDSFNMLAPVDATGYAEYEAARGGVALPVEDFTSLGTSLPLPDGRNLGLHSTMPELHGLYTAGKAAFVSNVGTLIEPTTLATIDSGNVKLPLGLFSHSDQQKHWQSGLPQERSALNGWGGKMSDCLNDLNSDDIVSMNVSLAGYNLFQTHGSLSIFSRSSAGLPGLVDWDKPSYLSRRTSMETMLEAEYHSIFQRTQAALKKNAIEAIAAYKEALQLQGPLQTTFDSANPLSVQLKAVAETIAAREDLGKRRQTFFVQIGGWDHHTGLDKHPAMMATVSQAIGEFQTAMVELGVEDQVTTFSASDFGRTLSPNGSGTDHGWGGNQFVVGGAVDGGKIYGEYPELALGNILDTGRGRLIPTTSVDEYAADLALWMGVPSSDLHLVLPNLDRFHDVIVDGVPLGLMS